MSNNINTILYSGDADALSDFFKSGGTTDDLDESYIQIAARDGHLDALKILHTHGVNLNFSDSGDLLIVALGTEDELGRPLQENLALTQFLVEEVGINVNAEDSIFTGRTALFRAARLLFVDTVKYLVNQGANADKFDDSHENALWYAVKKNITTSKNGVFNTDLPEFLAIAEFLLEHGASIHRQDISGGSAVSTVELSFSHKLKVLFATVEKPASPSGFHLTLNEKSSIGFELELGEDDTSDPQIVAYLKSETIPLDTLTLDQRYRVLDAFVSSTDIRDVISRLQEVPSILQEFSLLSIQRLPPSDWNKVEFLMALNKHFADSEAVAQVNAQSLDDEDESLRAEATEYFETINNI